jgi:hypothetical protein
LVVEQRLTAVVQRVERGQFGDLETEVCTQMPQHTDGKGVEGIQRAPGHLDKPHMHSSGEPVVPIARQNRLALVWSDGKKVLDLKRGEIRRELMQTKEWKLPVLHGTTLTRRLCVL